MHMLDFTVRLAIKHTAGDSVWPAAGDLGRCSRFALLGSPVAVRSESPQLLAGMWQNWKRFEATRSSTSRLGSA